MDRCTFCGTQGAKVKCKGGCIAKYCNEACAREHARCGHQLPDDEWGGAPRAPRTYGGQRPCEQLKRLGDDLEDIRNWEGKDMEGITSDDEDDEDDIVDEMAIIAAIGSKGSFGWRRARCSNEGCQKFGGKKCKACGATKYCSKECQVAHWKAGHKRECKIYQEIRAGMLQKARAELRDARDAAESSRIAHLDFPADENRKLALGKKGKEMRDARQLEYELNEIRDQISQVEAEIRAEQEKKEGGRKRRKTRRRKRRRTRRKRRRKRRRTRRRKN